MIRLFSTTALVCLASLPANAQELTFATGGLEYSSFDEGSGDDLTSTNVFGAVEGSFDQFYLGAEVNTVDFEEVQYLTYGLSVGYFVAPGALVGASLVGLSETFNSNTFTASGYEVFGQYETGQFGLAVNYSVPYASEDFDLSILQLFAVAEVMPGFEVGAMRESYDEEGQPDYSVHYINAQYETGAITVRGYHLRDSNNDGGFWGANGSYELGNGLSVMGSAETATGEIFGDADYFAYAAGAGYEVAPGIEVSGRIGRITIDETELSSMGLELTYVLGERARLDRTFLNEARKDLQSGYSGIFPSFGNSLFALF